MTTVYTNGTWKIKKRDGMYRIYNSRNYIDESESFNEAYDLLDKYKKSENE